jgi:hypothetical protein
MLLLVRREGGKTEKERDEWISLRVNSGCGQRAFFLEDAKPARMLPEEGTV